MFSSCVFNQPFINLRHEKDKKERKKEARIRQIPARHQDSSPYISISIPSAIRHARVLTMARRRRRSGMSQHCIEVAGIERASDRDFSNIVFQPKEDFYSDPLS